VKSEVLDKLKREIDKDARAFSERPIVPPPGLPFVSRKALQRIVAPLPTFPICNCGKVSVIANNSIIYDTPRGKWPYVYYCNSCGDSVGLHPSTDIPLGTLANAELLKMRNSCKSKFLQVCNIVFPRRRQHAYRWLAKELCIDEVACHWALFDSEMCKRARMACVIKLSDYSLKHPDKS